MIGGCRSRGALRASLAAPAVAAGLALAALACGGSEKPPSAAASIGAAAGGDPAADARQPGTETTGAPGGGATAPDAAAPAGAVPPPDGKGPLSAPAEPNHREVVLFFGRDADDSLGPERRRIRLTPSVADQARQIVDELIAGPQAKGLLPTIPEKTRVLGVYLDKSGTAFIDLSDEFVTMHPGGSSEEMATVFSIVDSLAYNLPEIRRVRFLVGGEERDTLHNHLDLRRAWLKDMSIVRMQEGG